MSTIRNTKKPKAPKLFPDERIDQLLAQIQNKDAESFLGESGLAGQLKKQLTERMLAAELTHHLDAEAKLLAQLNDIPCFGDRQWRGRVA